MANTIAESWMELGRAEEARTLLRELLEDRFGALPQPLLDRIRATVDLDRLRAAARQVARLEKLDDLSL